jgi:hypothetical protein
VLSFHRWKAVVRSRQPFERAPSRYRWSEAASGHDPGAVLVYSAHRRKSASTSAEKALRWVEANAHTVTC